MRTVSYNQAPFHIDDLPNELLGEVFRHYVSLDHSPWLLASISRKWHKVVLGQPSLWTYIIVNDAGYGVDEKWDLFGTTGYSQGRASVCHNVEEVKATVRRTGALPLHLRIVLRYRGALGPARVALLDEALCPSIANRTVELHISIINNPGSSHIPLFGQFTALRVLHINEIPGQWMRPFLQAIYSSSGNSLLSFQLPKRCGHEHMGDIITHCTKLEQFGNWPTGWPHENTPTTMAPRLMELSFNCTSIGIFKLRLPQLRSLVIFVTFPLPNHESPPPLELPYLTDLHVTSSNTRWLEFLSAPKLQTFMLVGVDPTSSYPQVHLLPPNLFPTVKSFSHSTGIYDREGIDPEDTLLISSLQAVPSAKTVRIKMWYAGYGDVRLRTHFFERLASRDKDNMLCPKLQHLELASFPWRREFRAPFEGAEVNLVQQIADVRKHMGHELLQCVVKQRNPAGDTVAKEFAAGSTVYPEYIVPEELPVSASPSVWMDMGRISG